MKQINSKGYGAVCFSFLCACTDHLDGSLNSICAGPSLLIFMLKRCEKTQKCCLLNNVTSMGLCFLVKSLAAVVCHLKLNREWGKNLSGVKVAHRCGARS